MMKSLSRSHLSLAKLGTKKRSENAQEKKKDNVFGDLEKHQSSDSKSQTQSEQNSQQSRQGMQHAEPVMDEFDSNVHRSGAVLLENQRQLTQRPESDGALVSPNATVGASNLGLHGGSDVGHAGLTMARDRLMLGGDPTASSHVEGGMVAGLPLVAAGGQISDGTSLTGFGAGLGSVGAAGLTVKTQVGQEVLAVTPLVVVDMGTAFQVHNVAPDSNKAEVTFTTRVNGSISGILMVGFGLAGLAIRMGGNIGRQVSFRGEVDQKTANEMQKVANSPIQSAMVAAGLKEQPGAIPQIKDLSKLIENDALKVGESVNLKIAATGVAGMAASVGGAMIGFHVAVSGDFDLSVEATESGYRSSVSVVKLKEFTVAADVPLLSVGTASLAKGTLRQSVYDFDKSNSTAIEALTAMIKPTTEGIIRLPRPLMSFAPSSLVSTQGALEEINEQALPGGVTLVKDISARLDHKFSLKSAMTLPMYLLANTFGSVEASMMGKKMRSLGVDGRRAEAVEISGHERKVQVFNLFEERSEAMLQTDIRRDLGDSHERISWRMRASLQVKSRLKDVNARPATWLNELFGTSIQASDTSVSRGRIRRDAVQLTVFRDLSVADWASLIKTGAINDRASYWSQRLASAQTDAERMTVIRSYADMAATRIKIYGAKEAGRLHRLLGSHDALSYEYEDHGLLRVAEKIRDKQVKHFASLNDLSPKKMGRAVEARLGDIERVMDLADNAVERFESSPIVGSLNINKSVEREKAMIEELSARLAEVIDTTKMNTRDKLVFNVAVDSAQRKRVEDVSSRASSRRASTVPSAAMSRRGSYTTAGLSDKSSPGSRSQSVSPLTSAATTPGSSKASSPTGSARRPIGR